MSQQANRRSTPVFDKWSRSYDNGRISGFFQEIQSLVIEKMGLSSPDHLLDVGCGTGWAVEHATQRKGVGYATGLDLSGGMIEQARAKRGQYKNVSFVERTGSSKRSLSCWRKAT